MMCMSLGFSSSKMLKRIDKFFWVIVGASYIAVIALCAIRIYVHQDYPIFYTEEEIPDVAGEIFQSLNVFDL